MLSWIAAWAAYFGVQPAHFFAGLAGGVIRAVVNKNGSVWERIASGFVGTLCASFLTPLVALLFTVTGPQIVGAIAFVLGMVGMSVCETLIALGKSYARQPSKLKDDVTAFLLRLLAPKDK